MTRYLGPIVPAGAQERPIRSIPENYSGIKADRTRYHGTYRETSVSKGAAGSSRKVGAFTDSSGSSARQRTPGSQKPSGFR